jgi:hypothetical protein
MADATQSNFLRLGYFANIQRFNGKASNDLDAIAAKGLAKSELGDLPANLMEKNINQHGVLLEYNRNVGGQSNWSLAGAALYDTYDKRFEYLGRANLNCWINQKCRVSVGVEYLSFGQGANNNGAIVSGTAGMLIAF